MDKYCNIHNIEMEEIATVGDVKITACPKCAEEKKAEEKAKNIQLKNERLSEAYGKVIPPKFINDDFTTYSLNGNGNQKAVYDLAVKFAKNPMAFSGLLLVGKHGTGKTHLAFSIIREVISKGHTARYTEAIKIFRSIKESWHPTSAKLESEVLKGYKDPDVLVVDEIDVRYESKTETNILTEIINDRVLIMKPTVLISNLSLSAVKDLIGERAFDRFKDGGLGIACDWDSYRGSKGIV